MRQGRSDTHPTRTAVLAAAALLAALCLAPAFTSDIANAQPNPPGSGTCPPNSESARGRGGVLASLEIPMPPGVASSVAEDGTIGVAVPIENASDTAVFDLHVTEISISNAVSLEPVSLPVGLGDLGPREVVQVDTRIEDRDGHLNEKYRVVVRGYFSQGKRECNFAVRDFFSPGIADDEATFPGREGEMVVQTPQEAEFPKPRDTTFDRFNSESPIVIPPGLERELFEPTPTPTGGEVPAGAPLDISRNLNSTSNNAGTPPDPNAARGTNGVVLATFNTGISFSTDGGENFTDVNLLAPVPGQPGRTSFFPQSDAGLCCDQVVIYVPQRNLFVWLLQYWPISSTTGGTTTIDQPNRHRIAWATPEAIADDFFNAWTYGDLTANEVPGVSSGLGAAANEWLDYPDLSFSDDFLYVATDRGFPDSPGSVYAGRRIVARLSLGDMADPSSGVVRYQFNEYAGSNGLNKSHFVQNVPGRMVLGSLDDTSTLRVYTWEDDAGSAFVRTVNISSITTNYTAPAPDGTDWYRNSFSANISGGTFIGGDYVFAFNGGVDGPDRPRPYVRLETVTAVMVAGIPLMSATDEYEIWNPDFAFGMGVISSQAREIGIGLAVGGGTIGFPQFAVGFKDDFFVRIVTAGNAVQSGRFGDYLSVRRIPNSLRFAAEFYDTLSTTGGGARAVVRYVEFGRPDDILF